VAFQKGRAKTGGRKPGVANVRTRLQKAEIAKRRIDPVDYLLEIVADETAPADRRDRAAAAAAPYCRPRLAVVDSTVQARVEVSASMSPEERRERARAAILQAFSERPQVIDATYHVVGGKDTQALVKQAAVTANHGEQANSEPTDESEG